MIKEIIREAENSIFFEKRTEDVFKKISFDDIVFFSLAERGAMGSPAELIVVTKHLETVKWYSFNMLVDKIDDLCAIYPPLRTFDCGMFGMASGIPDGWHHVYLGAGNHLLVRDDYYMAFQETVDELHPESPGEVYASWQGIAQSLLTMKTKTHTDMSRMEESIAVFSACSDEDKKVKLANLLESIRIALNNQEMFIIPAVPPRAEIEMSDPNTIKVGDVVQTKEDLLFNMLSVSLPDGETALAAFTCEDEAQKGVVASTTAVNIEEFLQKALLDPNVEGIVINPCGDDFYLSKDYIKQIFVANLPKPKDNTICFETIDITKAETDCIVNAANESLLGGGGVDGVIHRAAGPQLLEECRTLNGCKTGEAKITKGYNLKANYIIHTVGPKYAGSTEDAKLLRNCYWNSLELARKNEIHSITFPPISTNAYGFPLKEATEIALKTASDWLRINSHYGMAITFACCNEKATALYKSIWSEKKKTWNQRPILRGNNGMLEKGIQFAMDAHKGSVRKGTDRPYILHPIETLQILSSMNADTNLMIAGLLHDTLEDTNTTLLEIYDQFGVDVATLVNGHTEDKRKIWYMRKLITIHQLPGENVRQKMLAMADKVANLRSMLIDYKRIGDELWKRFNAPKKYQAWYYIKLKDALSEMQNYPETADVYGEMTALCKDLFVTYYVDVSNGLLYQISADGGNVVLKKGESQWNTFDGTVSKNARQIERREAERFETNWAEPLSAVHHPTD